MEVVGLGIGFKNLSKLAEFKMPKPPTNKQMLSNLTDRAQEAAKNKTETQIREEQREDQNRAVATGEAFGSYAVELSDAVKTLNNVGDAANGLKVAALLVLGGTVVGGVANLISSVGVGFS